MTFNDKFFFSNYVFFPFFLFILHQIHTYIHVCFCKYIHVCVIACVCIYVYIYKYTYALKPKKRFMDTIKYYPKQSGLPVYQWEKMASDKSKWLKLIHESIESFKNSHMLYSA